MRLLETTVTYLELRGAPARRAPSPRGFEDILTRRIERITLAFYRFLYAEVGRPHHWTSRHLADEVLRTELHHPGIDVHVLFVGGCPAGWFELDSVRKPGEARIVHFGMLPDFRGSGLARTMLSDAVEAAFATGAHVVTLETNTLDHPAALPLYRKFGFVPVGSKVVSTPAIDD